MNNIIKATSNDRVIFTSLKPMSEVSLSIPVLFYDERGDAITGIFFDAENIICDGVAIPSSEFIGWHYIPKFNPDWMDL